MDEGEDRQTVSVDGETVAGSVGSARAADIGLDHVVRALFRHTDNAVALHSASVGWGGKAILIVGPTGAGKTTLAGWFLTRGFEFLCDDVILATGGRETSTLPRPADDPLIDPLAGSRNASVAAAGPVAAITIPGASAGPLPAGLIVFPRFVAGATLDLESLSSGRTLVRLMECNLYAPRIDDHGIGLLKDFAKSVPAIALTYAGFDQLEDILDSLARLIVEQGLSPRGAKDLLLAFTAATAAVAARGVREKPPNAVEAADRPKARPPVRPKPTVAPKLTIGMATYDDYHGVYFVVQAIRLYHPEILDDVEFVIVDNNPDGPVGEALKSLELWIPNLRCVPNAAIKGTGARNLVFEEASGEYVLCLDCPVLIAGGALAKLIAYFERDSKTNDLLHGPLVCNDLTILSSHLTPEWCEGMFGEGEVDAAALNPDGVAFAIPMHGLELFACRRAAWPGFSRRFRGFGGEEGYIHEKFRRRGGRVLCLPFLRWRHPVDRPNVIPDPNLWLDRIRNYVIGFREIGWNTAPVEQHFKSYLGEDLAGRILTEIWADPDVIATEDQSPARHLPGGGGDPFRSVWNNVSLRRQREILRRTSEVAAKLNFRLYLYYGTLLGHVREGGILPWDADVDLAFFEAERENELRRAIDGTGLRIHPIRIGELEFLKIFDPSYEQMTRWPWTFPFVDIFLFSRSGAGPNDRSRMTVAEELVFPGREVEFEGAYLWEPENPLAILDEQYDNWRTQERTHYWDHIRESHFEAQETRPIVTNERGRKVTLGRS